MFKLGTMPRFSWVFDEAIFYKIKERGIRSHLAQSACSAGFALRPAWSGESELSKVSGRIGLEPMFPVSGPAYVPLCHPTALVSVLCYLSHIWGRGDTQGQQGPGPRV